MTDTKHTLNDLFYKRVKTPNDYSKKIELEQPLTLEEFYEIMTDTCNICADVSVLNRERLRMLYERYVSVFEKNRGTFYNTVVTANNSGRKKIYTETVFGELMPSTKVVTDLNYYVNRCYNNAEELHHNRQSQTSLQSFIKKYGEEEGRVKFSEFSDKRKELYQAKDETFKQECVKRMRKNAKTCVDHYVGLINPDTGKLYTESEIDYEIRKQQTIFSKKSAEKRKKQNEETHDVTCRQVNYWMRNGYSYDESVELVRKVQATNTIETYIKKYGYEMGVSEWNKRNSEWGERMRVLKQENGCVGNAYSKSACKLFDSVIETLSNEGIFFEKVYYGKKEFSKWDSDYNRVYFYDFVINDIKLCVEYNGIMFHPKPNDYEWKSLFSGKGYDEVREYDMRKQQLITDLGYTLIVVWEDDIFEKSLKKITDTCKLLLNSKSTN